MGKGFKNRQQVIYSKIEPRSQSRSQLWLLCVMSEGFIKAGKHQNVGGSFPHFNPKFARLIGKKSKLDSSEFKLSITEAWLKQKCRWRERERVVAYESMRVRLESNWRVLAIRAPAIPPPTITTLPPSSLVWWEPEAMDLKSSIQLKMPYFFSCTLSVFTVEFLLNPKMNICYLYAVSFMPKLRYTEYNIIWWYYLAH